MFKVEDGVVYLTRGDDAVIEVSIWLDDEHEEPYTLQEGDRLILTVSDFVGGEYVPLFYVESQSERIVISHEDTYDKEVGKYSADIQLNTADGKRYTIWPRWEVTKNAREFNYKNFCIMSEVTLL